MIRKLFDSDSRLSRFLSGAWDLMVLNAVTLLLCLPIITAGASLTAMHFVLIRLHRKEESGVLRDFFRSFKENFLQATLIWLLFFAAFLSFRVDFYFTEHYPEVFAPAVSWAVGALAAVLFMVLCWCLPLQARFTGQIFLTIRNAAVLAVSKVFRTIPMAAVWVIPWMLLNFSLISFPLLLMFGLSLPAYVGTCLYDPVFKELEERQEGNAPSKGAAAGA